MPYSVTLVEGVPSNTRRGIAFLESDSDGDVNGKGVFDGLRKKLKNDVRGRFDFWLSGGVCDKYFHGWPNGNNRKGCFVFKWKNAGALHRLYGFLFNPRPGDPRFQVCVLMRHTQKKEITDASELALVLRLKAKAAVVTAVGQAFE
jgi:hypothetical protein